MPCARSGAPISLFNCVSCYRTHRGREGHYNYSFYRQ
jgi:hypothetical protein